MCVCVCVCVSGIEGLLARNVSNSYLVVANDYLAGPYLGGGQGGQSPPP